VILYVLAWQILKTLHSQICFASKWIS